MLIKNWMSSPVVTIVPDANMPMAQKLMKKHNIHSLPVIKDDKLVGILLYIVDHIGNHREIFAAA
jgi:acetoin utilization protein AcuB